jgi:hypothetical protein
VAGTASRPASPTSSAAKKSDANSRRVAAAVPASAPIATAAVGDMSKTITASVASAIPRKIVGKTAPPRKPEPSQIA